MIERLGAMGDTICIGAEFGIVDDRLKARDRAELAPEIVVGDTDHDRSIRGLERLVGTERLVAGAAFGRLDAAFPERLQIVAQKAERGVEQ
jgi:hypothetical protein